LRIFIMKVSLLLAAFVSLSQADDSTVMALKKPLSKQALTFSQVKPILEKRCMVCHGCYDAPCQFKATSYTGLVRGASKIKVYDGTRIKAIDPTRLFIDAQTTPEWRQKGFYSVISARESGKKSVLYRMLHLKQKHPQPTSGILPKDYTLGLSRKDTCPKPAEMDQFEAEHPRWGMPYAMPNLEAKDYQKMLAWAELGAPGVMEDLNTPKLSHIASVYETYLNQNDIKHQLVARYIYEHLFLGHLHFSDTSSRTFYQLVRSSTPPSQPIKIIPSTRPFDAPHVKRVYYRLRPVLWSIVDKDHIVYSVQADTIKKYQTWFFSDHRPVKKLPSYQPVDSANPFKTFKDLSVKGRYKFMLDQAKFIIEGFIKGPVCRGQIALNVIDEQFWVMFFDPDADLINQSPDFLASQADNLALPTELGVDTFHLWATYTKYQFREQLYLDAKHHYIEKMRQKYKGHLKSLQGLNKIWHGNGKNQNAILTIFRNQDSATVMTGFQGKIPKTAWVIDYPLLERIQYLLVSGFDVYGNVGHQLNTRLYMDFLRMEGENNFLGFLPPEDREALHDYWYRKTPIEYIENKFEPLNTNLVFFSKNHKNEFLQMVRDSLSPQVLGNKDDLNQCLTQACSQNPSDEIHHVEQVLRQVSQHHGDHLVAWPEVTFLRVRLKNGQSLVYTLFFQAAHYNVSSLFSGRSNRDPKNDTVTIVKGVHASYPNLFLDIKSSDISGLAKMAASVSNKAQLTQLVAKYGVRRTSPHFWATADFFEFIFEKQNPVESGILDLNRYIND